MKILAVADIHYALKQYDWLMSVAQDFDLVVVAGDLLDIASIVERRAQVVVVRTYLEELASKTRVIVCSGNHDLDAPDAHGENAALWVRDLDVAGLAADGANLFVGDTLVSVCPWWDGPGSRAALGAQLAAGAALRRGAWIWVYHAPPADSPVSWGGTRHHGDRELSAWIAEHAPDLVISGHVHQSPFVRNGSWVDRIGSTWVFNTGQQIGPTPSHIVVNTEAQAAIWFSISGTEHLALDQPLVRPLPPLSAIPDWLKV
jgi:Icc-related predicted phosphoesterase